MAWLRKRWRHGKRRYFIRTRSGSELSAGTNLNVAKRLVSHYDGLERLERVGIIDPTTSDWTLKTLAEWDAGRNPEPSRARRWAVLRAHFGDDFPIDGLTSAKLYGYAEARQKAAKPAKAATINRDLSLLAAALRRARRNPDSGYSRDPFSSFELLDERPDRRASVALTPKDARKVIREAWRLWPIGGAVVELLALTGSRLSQILQLERGQVRGGRLTFAGHKGGETRTFELTPRLRSVLRDRRQDRLFDGVSADGSGSNFRRFWRRLVKRTGLPIRPHDLRHTAASAAFRAGASVADVQQLLGHKSPQMAERLYIHTHPKILKPVSYDAHVRPTRGSRRGRSRAGSSAA